mmetsp:Transcript_104593/g.263317  ORF Transcript_104593/g.263317 Transcript_104593/m.263317 type:complete len:280 (-) Transcript_104593:928-1767(-)
MLRHLLFSDKVPIFPASSRHIRSVINFACFMRLSAPFCTVPGAMPPTCSTILPSALMSACIVRILCCITSSWLSMTSSISLRTAARSFTVALELLRKLRRVDTNSPRSRYLSWPFRSVNTVSDRSTSELTSTSISCKTFAVSTLSSKLKKFAWEICMSSSSCPGWRNCSQRGQRASFRMLMVISSRSVSPTAMTIWQSTPMSIFSTVICASKTKRKNTSHRATPWPQLFSPTQDQATSPRLSPMSPNVTNMFAECGTVVKKSSPVFVSFASICMATAKT